VKILLAIDSSGHSEAAIHQVASRHFPPGSEVRIISVVERPHYAATYAGGTISVTLYEELEQDARERARGAVEKAEATLRVGKESREHPISEVPFCPLNRSKSVAAADVA
jgi:hypothetical protein